MTWINELPAAVLALLGTLLVGGPIAWVTHWLGQRAKREEGLAGLAERLTASTLARQDTELREMRVELRELRGRLDASEKRFDMLKEHAEALAEIIHQLIELVRHARNLVQPPPKGGWPPIPPVPKPLATREASH